jgi:hypothetical protein
MVRNGSGSTSKAIAANTFGPACLPNDTRGKVMEYWSFDSPAVTGLKSAIGTLLGSCAFLNMKSKILASGQINIFSGEKTCDPRRGTNC